MEFPITPGRDGCGEIIELGRNVDGSHAFKLSVPTGFMIEVTEITPCKLRRLDGRMSVLLSCTEELGFVR